MPYYPMYMSDFDNFRAEVITANLTNSDTTIKFDHCGEAYIPNDTIIVVTNGFDFFNLQNSETLKLIPGGSGVRNVERDIDGRGKKSFNTGAYVLINTFTTLHYNGLIEEIETVKSYIMASFGSGVSGVSCTYGIIKTSDYDLQVVPPDSHWLGVKVLAGNAILKRDSDSRTFLIESTSTIDRYIGCFERDPEDPSNPDLFQYQNRLLLLDPDYEKNGTNFVYLKDSEIVTGANNPSEPDPDPNTIPLAMVNKRTGGSRIYAHQITDLRKFF